MPNIAACAPAAMHSALVAFFFNPFSIFFISTAGSVFASNLGAEAAPRGKFFKSRPLKVSFNLFHINIYVLLVCLIYLKHITFLAS